MENNQMKPKAAKEALREIDAMSYERKYARKKLKKTLAHMMW